MIRIAQVEDIPAIYEIYCFYVEHGEALFDLRPQPFEAFQRMWKQQLAMYPAVVAERDGSVIGYAAAHPAFSKDAYQFCMELSIYFMPGDHFGLAGPLYEALERFLIVQGCRWIVACITETNEASLRFHEARGFVWSGALPACGHKHGGWHGVVWYRKELNADPKRWIPFSEVIALEAKRSD
ncbi:GNAT family N-acetyltransferase [Dubosiella muris]|uniref:N-acetyltransferase family protein n=1 Tax=Dubosiella muris TaxID=3038133 RepID=A0AC61R632_9FIRM|nr:GNAT family N-acetyltransferase [Dubosiella muris]TGY65278.1 N-acetyltransferase family protein [Dubosiella muris]